MCNLDKCDILACKVLIPPVRDQEKLAISDNVSIGNRGNPMGLVGAKREA